MMNTKGKYIYDWPRPMVTVDALIIKPAPNTPQILLIQRAHDPFAGQWALPGGFVDMDEELDVAAARELYEEAHLKNIPLNQLQTFGTVGRDPRGRQITIVFWGILNDTDQKIKAGDDAADAKWFDINALPQKLSFDHTKVIAFAIKKLKSTLETL